MLEQHPDIAVTACIGIPDDYWGEIVGVFIKRVSNEDANTKIGNKSLKLWLRNKLAPHKVPDHIFWLGDGAGVPDELPFNHTGKLMKGELRDIAHSLIQDSRS